tara:strand:+ start:182 stop:376 length:195 start_codon:yes stop_codon:yes gene_type:complete
MSKLKDEMILIGMCRSCVHIEYKDHNFCPKVANYVSPTWGCRDWELSDEDSLRIEMQKEKHRLN